MSNNNHNLTLRSILDKDKLTGSNFLDWQRNVVIVLRLKKKEYVLKRAIPPVPAANASRAIKDTYEKHVDDEHEVACLMLAMMTSDLQKHHESMKAYDMIIHLRQLYQGQARHERFQISKALFSCKLSVGNPVGPHVLKMIGYVQTLEKLGFELRTELATDLILQSLPELYKQFVVNYEMHELDKPLPELLKMLQTAEESLTKGKGNFVLLVQGGKGKKKFKKAKKNGPKGKGNTEPKSNSSKLKPKGGVAKDSICHHCGENGEEVPMKKVGETTVPKTEDEYEAQDIKKIENNAKAINILYCAVNPDDYRKISSCSTAKEMWDKLEITYEGTDQVREAKIDFLTHEYELFHMKENEKIDNMFERFSKIVNDLHALKKTYTDNELVRKILRSLTPEWRSKADAIQESIGITSVTIDGLRGGQRKRSRTGKNVASSSAPPPPAHQYLDGSFLWFNNHEEAMRFSEKFEHREILPPRFSTARFIHDSIPREARVILERGNFLDLLYIKKANYHPFLVRAFYSNLKKDEDGALISNVNGVDIYLNEENIQILTGLRRDGQDLGLYVGEEGARFNETALLEEVGIRNFVPTPQQRRPTIASMSFVFRFIFNVLTRILKPRKFNHTTLSQEDTKTIHAMIQHANLNWCKFVMTHMFTATSDNRPLPYALLVMAILEEYNIKTDVGPKIKGTKHWEIDESSFHSGTNETPFRQPRPRRQPRATASTATTSTNPSLAEQMAALTATLSRIDTNVSKMAHNVNTLSRELHGYFDFVNYPYAQMVPYVPPPNFGGEQSRTQNVGRDEEVHDEEEEEEEEEEADDDDGGGGGDGDEDEEEEEDIDEDQLLNDLSPDF
ncbi:unnamed protein product [Cuscuta campestris]|uniref:Retrotransposon Copia-like N-terminal domain-containing protein n=1 Tax=Cuscuta campestris TaxID=132261 RepID=A0A484MH17_9ASTE|nr:unnamed protein product [Cuscuta campestris]